MKGCSVIAFVVGMFFAVSASASLVGDEIGIQFNVNGYGFQFDNSVIVADPGVEASFGAGNVDVLASSFVFSYTALYDVDFSTLYLSDLDFSGPITGLQLTGGAAGNIISTAFTADSVTVLFDNTVTTQNDNRVYAFDILTSEGAIPLPGTVALFALGLLGLASSRRKGA